MATDLDEDTEPASQATIRARRTPESSYERFGRANRRTERVGEQRRKRRPAIHRLCLFQKKSASFTYSNRGLGTRVHLATRRDTDLFSYDLFV